MKLVKSPVVLEVEITKLAWPSLPSPDETDGMVSFIKLSGEAEDKWTALKTPQEEFAERWASLRDEVSRLGVRWPSLTTKNRIRRRPRTASLKPVQERIDFSRPRTARSVRLGCHDGNKYLMKYM